LTSVRFNFDGAERYKSAVLASMEAGVQAASLELSGQMQRGFSRGARHTSSAPGTPPNVQTGRLRNSIAVQKSGPLIRRVGTNLPYGRIQEFGGTITAKGKYLLVPIGVQGKNALRDSGGNIRSLNLMLIKRAGRPPLLCQGSSKLRGKGRGSVTPLFVLLPRVTLQARPWAMPALNRAKPRMGKAFIQYAKNDLRRRIGGAA